MLEQEYPGGFELVLAVGPSKDRTEAIARELAAADSRITVVPNPSGQIASAMNAAVKAARHPIITRIDGHALLPDGYLRTAVRTLLETGAADVGGVMAAEGITPFQQAVAWAMTSPAGMGAAANHTGGEAGPADTVYLGVYRRQAIEQVGGYDETMLIAEDWELNYRIRAAGHLIWFTPELRVTYRPRASLARPGQAALPLRALAAGRRAPLPGDGEPPLPGGAGRDRAQRRRPGPRRAPGSSGRRPGRPGSFRTSASASSFPSSTWPGSPGSAVVFAGDLPAGVAGPGAAGARRHAHVLGRRVPRPARGGWRRRR